MKKKYMNKVNFLINNLLSFHSNKKKNPKKRSSFATNKQHKSKNFQLFCKSRKLFFCLTSPSEASRYLF